MQPPVGMFGGMAPPPGQGNFQTKTAGTTGSKSGKHGSAKNFGNAASAQMALQKEIDSNSSSDIFDMFGGGSYMSNAPNQTPMQQ